MSDKDAVRRGYPGTQTAWPTGQRYAHQTLVDPRKGSVEAP